MFVTATPNRAALVERTRVSATRRPTPSKLRLAAGGIAVLIVATGFVGVLITVQRQDAISRAWQGAEPLMVTAQSIDTSLSDADTTAAASFLQGRLVPETLEQRYRVDLATASSDLAAAAGQAGSDPAAATPLRTLVVDLPLYSGIVTTAEFNERQASYPLAASYLAEANNLMRTSILPASVDLYETEVSHLDGDQAVALSTPLPWLAGTLMCALFVALLLVQRYVSRQFHRTWNVALVAATLVFVAAGTWATIALAEQNNGVSQAVADGSRPVTTFTQARILALRARADDELTLLTRDEYPAYQADYGVTASTLQRALQTPAAGDAEREELAYASGDFAEYQAVHHVIRHDDRTGDLGGAVTFASGIGANDLPAVSNALDTSLGQGITTSEQTFVDTTSGAAADLDGLIWGIGLGSLLALVLVVVGFRPRVREYR